MLERVPSRLISEWMEYANLEPFGEERADLRAGIVASTMANVWRGKNGKAAKPGDFMPKFGGEQPKEPQSLEQMKLAQMRISAVVGGKS